MYVSHILRCTSVFLWSWSSKIAIKLYACRPSSEWLHSVKDINKNYFLHTKLVKIFKTLIFLNVNGFVPHRPIAYNMILKDIHVFYEFKFINHFPSG